jgi:uncharacterized protein (DUF1778 family)
MLVETMIGFGFIEAPCSKLQGIPDRKERGSAAGGGVGARFDGSKWRIAIMRATDNQRVSARVSSKVYDALAQAAELTGATLNQFLVQSAYEKAQEVIEKERFIKMTVRSASAFFDALEQPPPPNKKLRLAVKSYRKAGDAAEN